MFASLQLLNAPLNHHFRQQQLSEQQDPFQFNPSGFPFFTPSQSFIPQPVKTEDSAELCLNPGLLYHEDVEHSGCSGSSSSGSLSSSEEPSTPPASSHAQIIPQKRRSPSVADVSPSSEDGLPTPTAAATTATVTKPKRAAPATRISSKDFIPPDVTGLSKREARLVKNRAAAFLSRQRKREEFEALEIHAQELEAENAQLRSSNPHTQVVVSDSKSHAEIERLNAELDTANRRADLLESDLTRLRAAHAEVQRQLAEALASPPAQSHNEVDMEIPSPSLSSSGDSDSSSDASAPKELTSKHLMMALLMLLSPVLSHDSQKSVKIDQQPEQQSLSASEASYSLLFPVQTNGGFIPTTPFEQFLKPEMLGSMDPSSFYSAADLDMNTGLGLNLGLGIPSYGQQQQTQGFAASVATSYGSGFGELDLLKSPMSQPHTGESSTPLERAVELEVEILRDPQDTSKARIRLAAPFQSLLDSQSSSLPRDFLGFPPSPITGLDGVTYSFSAPDGKPSQERKRLRISLDSEQGWNIHVEGC